MKPRREKERGPPGVPGSPSTEWLPESEPLRDLDAKRDVRCDVGNELPTESSPLPSRRIYAIPLG